jgi:molybdopterin biosynthesis enzyme
MIFVIKYIDSLKTLFRFRYFLGRINIPISYSLKKISYNNILSNINVPSFDNSSMDGFLIFYNDFFFFSEIKHYVIFDVEFFIYAGNYVSKKFYKKFISLEITTGSLIFKDFDCIDNKCQAINE